MFTVDSLMAKKGTKKWALVSHALWGVPRHSKKGVEGEGRGGGGAPWGEHRGSGDPQPWAG